MIRAEQIFGPRDGARSLALRRLGKVAGLGLLPIPRLLPGRRFQANRDGLLLLGLRENGAEEEWDKE